MLVLFATLLLKDWLELKALALAIWISALFSGKMWTPQASPGFFFLKYDPFHIAEYVKWISSFLIGCIVNGVG